MKLQILKENQIGRGILIENNNPETFFKRTLNESNYGGLFKVSGIIAQGDKINKNERDYPYDEVLYPAFEIFRKELVERNMADCALEYPDHLDFDWDRTVARLSKIWYERPNIYGEAIVLDEGLGKLVQSFYRAGFDSVGCSTRGTGEVGRDKKVKGYAVHKVDFVWNQSAPDARLYYMTNEASELIYNEHLLTEQELESFTKMFKKLNPNDRSKHLDLYNKMVYKMNYNNSNKNKIFN